MSVQQVLALIGVAGLAYLSERGCSKAYAECKTSAAKVVIVVYALFFDLLGLAALFILAKVAWWGA